ncbi:MAG: cupin domain-containing protein [Elusimicrobia bacterium]|nr:cupin domain-containing protein [Elusimicrobiota bacterium]
MSARRAKPYVSHVSRARRHVFFKLQVRPVSGPRHIPNVGAVHVRLPPRYEHHAIFHRRTREWIYILSGSGKGVIGGRSVRLRPGSVLYIPPKMPHQMSTGSSPIEALVLFSPPMSLNADKMDVCRPGSAR